MMYFLGRGVELIISTNMNGGKCELEGAVSGLMSAPSLIDNPKGVRIHTVENGFTVALDGGKQKAGKPYRHSCLHVAKDEEEALRIAKDFLAAE